MNTNTRKLHTNTRKTKQTHVDYTHTKKNCKHTQVTYTHTGYDDDDVVYIFGRLVIILNLCDHINLSRLRSVKCERVNMVRRTHWDRAQVTGNYQDSRTLPTIFVNISIISMKTSMWRPYRKKIGYLLSS